MKNALALLLAVLCCAAVTAQTPPPNTPQTDQKSAKAKAKEAIPDRVSLKKLSKSLQSAYSALKDCPNTASGKLDGWLGDLKEAGRIVGEDMHYKTKGYAVGKDIVNRDEEKAGMTPASLAIRAKNDLTAAAGDVKHAYGSLNKIVDGYDGAKDKLAALLAKLEKEIRAEIKNS